MLSKYVTIAMSSTINALKVQLETQVKLGLKSTKFFPEPRFLRIVTLIPQGKIAEHRDDDSFHRFYFKGLCWTLLSAWHHPTTDLGLGTVFARIPFPTRGFLFIKRNWMRVEAERSRARILGRLCGSTTAASSVIVPSITDIPSALTSQAHAYFQTLLSSVPSPTFQCLDRDLYMDYLTFMPAFLTFGETS